MARLTDTISGAIATFRTPGKQDIRSLKVHFAPVQEGSGDPSPTNVRPISGWTGCEVYQSGLDTSNPTTLPLDWTDSAGTVYGGYVDLVSGEVWADTRLLTIDSTTSFYVGTKRDGTNKYFYIEDLLTENRCKYTSGQFSQAQSSELFSHGVIGNSWSTTTNDAYTAWVFSTSANTTIRFAVPTSEGITTVALMQDWIAEHGALQISYPLATPVLLTTLTPTALRTLIGTNNIWSNANGNVDVEYDFAESREMMEARKRAATFKWKRSRLPAGYREVEYLESRSDLKGMQWPYINTGIGASVNKNTKAEITFHIDCDEAFVFGARYTTSMLMFNINRPSSEGAIRVDIGSNSSGNVSKVNYFNHSDTGTYTVHMEYYSASVKRHSDGSVMDTSYTHSVTTGVTAPNLYLFAVATGSSTMSCTINNGILRIMSTKIWEGDPSVLVRDFVPCIRKSDNKAGMYDLVNNVFYLPTYGKFFTNLD